MFSHHIAQIQVFIKIQSQLVKHLQYRGSSHIQKKDIERFAFLGKEMLVIIFLLTKQNLVILLQITHIKRRA